MDQLWLQYSQYLLPTFLRQHIVQYSTVYIAVYAWLLSFATTAATFMNAVIQKAVSTGDFTSLLVLLVVGLVSFQLALTLARSIVQIVKWTLTIVALTLLSVLLLYIAMRGPDDFFRDVNGVVALWNSEYQRYESELQAGRRPSTYRFRY